MSARDESAVPVGPEPQAPPLSGPICSQAEARAAGLDVAPSVEELDAMAESIVAVGDPLSAEVSLAQAVPLLGAAVTGLRARVAEAVATAARQAQKIAQLERIANAERERVAELEEQLAAKDRPVDEDPIVYELTAEASCGRALATGKPCPDHPKLPQDVTPQVRKLRSLLAGQRTALEDPHDSPLRHDYRVGRDLPQTGSAQ